jgi:hypothetical protein
LAKRGHHRHRAIGHPVPAFSTALAYYDGYRSERLPANLLQAQRDYFGAHTYERTDKPGVYHTEWADAAPCALNFLRIFGHKMTANAGRPLLAVRLFLPTGMGGNYCMHRPRVIR